MNNLLMAFEIAEFEGVRQFLEFLSVKRGFIKKGGIYDL